MKKTILMIAAAMTMMTPAVYAGSENALHIVQMEVASNAADKSAEAYRPPVVANCEVLPGQPAATMPAPAALHMPGISQLISYPPRWSRKGLYINSRGEVASCYAPKVKLEKSSGSKATTVGNAGFWDSYSSV